MGFDWSRDVFSRPKVKSRDVKTSNALMYLCTPGTDGTKSDRSECVVFSTILSHLRGLPINATIMTSAHRRALVRVKTAAVSNRA